MNGSSTTGHDNMDDIESMTRERKTDRINVMNEKKDEENKQQINCEEINGEGMSTSGKNGHNLSKLEIKVARDAETGLLSDSSREGKSRGDASTVLEKISSSSKTTNDQQETEIMKEKIFPVQTGEIMNYLLLVYVYILSFYF